MNSTIISPIIILLTASTSFLFFAYFGLIRKRSVALFSVSLILFAFDQSISIFRELSRALPAGQWHIALPAAASLFAVIGFVFLRADYRSLQRYNMLLKDNMEKYFSIFYNSNEAFLLYRIEGNSLNGTFIDANNAAVSILGYSMQELLALSIDDIIVKSAFTSISEIKKKLLEQNYNNFQMQVRRKDSSIIPAEISFHAYSLKHDKVILLIMRDISEQKKIEETIRISLEEKELLLYEIHHRVKNNLQIISSLLDMSAMRISDSYAQGLIKDVQSKILTMSIIHNSLYKSSRFDSINVGECLRDIISNMGRLYDNSTIDIQVESSEIFLPIHTAIPCCLVLNEALSNASKHAFTRTARGTIRVSAKKNDDGEVLISVKDDGSGIPDTIDITKTTSIGLKLMRTLVNDQLKGRISINRDSGTEVAFRFTPPGQ